MPAVVPKSEPKVPEHPIKSGPVPMQKPTPATMAPMIHQQKPGPKEEPFLQIKPAPQIKPQPRKEMPIASGNKVKQPAPIMPAKVDPVPKPGVQGTKPVHGSQRPPSTQGVSKHPEAKKDMIQKPEVAKKPAAVGGSGLGCLSGVKKEVSKAPAKKEVAKSVKKYK